MIVLAIPFAVAGAFAALFYAWQEIYGFHATQGDSWAWVWKYLQAYGQPPGFIQWGIFGATAGTIALILLIQAIAMRIGGQTRHGSYDEKNLHGSARWARKADVKEAGLLRKTGVVVGGWPKWRGAKTLRHDGPEHILTFAPTRSGKGVGLVLPTLLSWPSSVLVLDIKGENWRLTSGWRASQGQRILKFDPTAEEGACHYNPLAEVRIGTGHEVADAQNIATMIIDPDGKGLADFWQKSGYAWLTGAILYTLYKIRRDENRIASLPDIDAVLTAVGEGLDSLLADMVSVEAGTEAATRLIQAAAQEMRDRAAQERSGVQSSSKVDLSLYRDPMIARNISGSDFRLDELMNSEVPLSLYIIIPPSDIDRLRPLLRIILNLFMRRLMQNVGADGRATHKHRLLLMLDEFTSIGKLEIFERSLAFMAGYGLKAFLIIQDLLQLQGTYGKENSIMGNCHIRIAYAPNDVTTAKTLSDMCGKATIVQTKRSRSRRALQVIGGNVTDNVSEVGRPLLTPDECMRLKAARKSRRDPEKIVEAGDMLVFSAGAPPILGRQPLYFFDKTLLARSRMAPVGTVEAANDESVPQAEPPMPSPITARLRAAGQS
ncbi:Conjugal transfer protein traG [Magnetospirillum gryphiswaldense MSR-1 v2]|uniref:Conjugal transfer protein traG n=2 Tax=Magnetospirillum gryphiswaldense TaxID=55518 RepID=V6F2I5_MAGGM|nr:type IV secretory system conjugative DNA transfer family protein [Magnetospirillum gryphiswaldense]CAM78253.1 TRAG protein [Magnetospirillum gryphiswaldense MSR-1]CDK99664.1 Conjugal transfer protein traG [Magnetospirillum gryphiswaldense MSR-1 v2]